MKVTQKNLIETFPKLSPKQALEITMLCNGTLDPETFPAGLARVSECYHRPDDTDLILTVVNELIGGTGVEGTPYKTDAMYSRDYISYVNMGDTYRATILKNPATNQFEISDWGLVYETSPAYQEYCLGDHENT